MEHDRLPQLEARLLDTVKTHGLFQSGDVVVVAASGGPDSMALLAALHRHQRVLGIELHVAHVNHGLRRAAGDDARLVVKVASEYGIPVSIENADVSAVAADTGRSVEEAAREVRYRFFSEVSANIGATKIATGHTADDQIETFIMRMVRGTGLEGLTGIPYVRPIDPVSGASVVRPILDVTRKQVLAYCADVSVAYVVDESNLSTEFTRNRVRGGVVPALDDVSEGWRERLLMMMDLLRDDQDFLVRTAVDQEPHAEIKFHSDGVSIERPDALAEMHPAIKSRIIRSAALRAGRLHGIDGRISSERVLGLLARINVGGNFTFELGGGLVAVKEYGRLTFTGLSSDAGEERPQLFGTIDLPGELDIPQMPATLVAEVIDRDSVDLSAAGPYSVFLDLDQISGASITVRSANAGDRFIPLGMTGSKKLQDFFVDIKLPQAERRRAIVLESDGTIIWLVGYRISAMARVTEATQRIVRLSLAFRLG